MHNTITDIVAALPKTKVSAPMVRIERHCKSEREQDSEFRDRLLRILQSPQGKLLRQLVKEIANGRTYID
jgi:hypothetical protein